MTNSIRMITNHSHRLIDNSKLLISKRQYHYMSGPGVGMHARIGPPFLPRQNYPSYSGLTPQKILDQ